MQKVLPGEGMITLGDDDAFIPGNRFQNIFVRRSCPKLNDFHFNVQISLGERECFV
jgi:hypothetical protein